MDPHSLFQTETDFHVSYDPDIECVYMVWRGYHTSALFRAENQQVLEVIGKLRREGVAVLLVEQNPLAALSVSDRVYVMDKGRIVHEGKAGVLKEDSSLRARLLGV